MNLQQILKKQGCIYRVNASKSKRQHYAERTTAPVSLHFAHSKDGVLQHGE